MKTHDGIFFSGCKGYLLLLLVSGCLGLQTLLMLLLSNSLSSNFLTYSSTVFVDGESISNFGDTDV